MNSLSVFLSSPLLDFIPSSSPSNNIERPDEIDILLQTLSERDIQLLDTEELLMTSAMMSTSKTRACRALPLPMLPISHAIASTPEIPLSH